MPRQGILVGNKYKSGEGYKTALLRIGLDEDLADLTVYIAFQLSENGLRKLRARKMVCWLMTNDLMFSTPRCAHCPIRLTIDESCHYVPASRKGEMGEPSKDPEDQGIIF